MQLKRQFEIHVFKTFSLLVFRNNYFHQQKKKMVVNLIKSEYIYLGNFKTNITIRRLTTLV